MKTILIALVFLASTNVFAAKLDKQLSCSVTSNRVKPWHNFVFTFEGSGNVALSWYEYPFKGAESVPVIGTTPGLQFSEVVNKSDNEIYIEWSGDGDAGYAKLKKNKKGRFVGTIAFPNSGPELYQDGSKDAHVTCFPSMTTTGPIEHNVVGTVQSLYSGEVDPYIVGDVSILYVRAPVTHNGKTSLRFLGFVADYEWLQNSTLEPGDKIIIPQDELVPLVEPSKLDLLLDVLDDVEYYKAGPSLQKL